MQTIGVRELRQQASRYLKRVERGETIQVTDHGHPVALLTPIPTGNIIEELIASGQMTPGQGDIRDLPPPLPPKPGLPLPSEILQTMRSDER